MILNAISKETYGSQFVAYRANNGNIKIEKKRTVFSLENKSLLKYMDSENILNFI
ncbi:MAG: hypothetical protein CM15mP102_22020 [Flavobacteriales bacterium]|nr:MAG: hypothetical protein CM15mP102_22020 [Flavobacteriales bacterium]